MLHPFGVRFRSKLPRVRCRRPWAMGWNRFAVGLAYGISRPQCATIKLRSVRDPDRLWGGTASRLDWRTAFQGPSVRRSSCGVGLTTLIGYGVEPLRGWIGVPAFQGPSVRRSSCGRSRRPWAMGWNRFAVQIGVPDFKASLFGPLFYPPVSLGKSGPEFRDFAPRNSSKTIDSPRPISENEGHDRHFTCPSLVHAHVPCRRRPGRCGESPRQPAPLPVSTPPPSPASPPKETRTLRVGLIAGPEATWDLAAARVAEHLRRDQGLEVYHAWDCVEFGHRRPDRLRLPRAAGLAGRIKSAQRVKRIELYCRGGGSLVALRAMHAEIPGWSNFAEEVLGGRQPAGRRCRLLEVERSESAWHHPVVEGVEAMIAEGEVYSGPRFSPDTTVLLTAGIGTSMSAVGVQPVAWTRRHEGGRVFCTTLGLDDDFREPSFLRLISNAVHWTGLVHG